MNEVLQALAESGFEPTSSDVVDGVAEWRYRNLSEGTGIRVQAREGEFWGWFSSLDAGGRIRPFDRDTVDLYWDDLGSSLGVPSPCGELELAEAVRAKIGALRARQTTSMSRLR
jgi:hypothetical protein